MRPSIYPFATSTPGSKTHLGLRWTTALAFVGGFMLIGAAGPAQASLALIRQGAESRGAQEPGDSYGRALATGDFNGDGIDDLAVGSPFEDVSGVSGAGAVVVSYGSEFGLKPEGAQLLLQSDGDALEFAASFGWSLAAGDFDDDGYDDLAVGAPSADYDANLINIGYVFVYAGGPEGLSYWHYLWQPGAGGTAEAHDAFGTSLCVGNFDGLSGSYEDLAIGSPGEDSDAGAVFYFTGGSNGLLNGSSGWRKQSTYGGTNVAGDKFGYSVAAAHVWGNEYDELIVGTPFKEVAGTVDAGIVWVILGTSTGPSTTSAESIEPDEDDLVNQPYPNGFFGWAVAGGRFFGGSFDGVAIGEPGRSYFGHPESGRVVVGRGSLLGLNFVDANAIALFQDDAGWALGNDDGFGRALAAGFYDTSDGYEDLAIGSPTDNANGGPFGAGVVSILFGGPSGPGSHGWVGWAEDAWHDDIEANDQFATSVVIGRFDGTGRGNLAIGAPGEDANAGMVCISAPWRQQQYPGYRTALAVDCEGNWVFALRPFDEVCIASTTKIMTVLLACERSELPPGDPFHVNLGLEYQVPDWIRERIGGSRYHFKDEQRLSGWDLLRCCLYPSGNDAAYAIADLLTGGNNNWNGAYDNTVPVFVAQMNARAAELGMTRTHFTNPAGLDKGGPKSCAHDMILLGQAAMANETFHLVASSTSFDFDTSYLAGGIVRVEFEEQLNYGFLQGLQNSDPRFEGVKPGWTPCANATGVYAKSHAFGTVFAATFGRTIVDDDWGPYYEEAPALVQLAAADCGGSVARDGAPPVSGRSLGGFRVDWPELSTEIGHYSGGVTELRAPAGGGRRNTHLDLLRPGGTGLTQCDLELDRGAELALPPSRSVTLGVAPFQAHGEIFLVNHGEANATIYVTTPQSGTPMAFNLAPGDRAVIAPYSGPQEPFWNYQIENPSGSESVVLGIVENYSWSLTGLPGGMTPAFNAQLAHFGDLHEQSVRVHVIGNDPVPGRSVYVSLHDPDVVLDASEEIVGGPDAATRLLPAFPNPFESSTRIAFDLPAGGDLRLGLFDPSGRRLRVLEQAGAAAGRGSFDWDGRSDDGRELAPGVYFYRLERDGREEASGRIIRGR